MTLTHCQIEELLKHLDERIEICQTLSKQQAGTQNEIFWIARAGAFQECAKDIRDMITQNLEQIQQKNRTAPPVRYRSEKNKSSG